jgi:RNA polymerase sigma factor for flagellar operon FliA
LKVTESRVCQLHGQALVRLKARLVDWRDRRDFSEEHDETKSNARRNSGATAKRTRPALSRA